MLTCLSDYISPIFGTVPIGLISTKTVNILSIDDTVSQLSFGLIIFRDFRFTGGVVKISVFPLITGHHYNSTPATGQPVIIIQVSLLLHSDHIDWR